MSTPTWEQVIMRLPEQDVRAALMLLHRRFPYETTQAINAAVGRKVIPDDTDSRRHGT